MGQSSRYTAATAALIALFLQAGMAAAQGYSQGQGGGAVGGAAGVSGSTGDAGLQKCARPMAAIAVVEPQSSMMAALGQYGLQSPTGLIRLMIQQSNCFIVVERGVGMQNAMQERQLSTSGELRQDSNMGGGQMVAADFILTPSVVFSENNAGGVGGALGGLLGGRQGQLVGTVAGGVKFKEAQTSMLISDARSSVQVAAAEGSTRKADLGLGTALFGSGASGAVGGYANTNEGKIIAAAFLDNYAKVVAVVRDNPSLQRNVGTLNEEAAKKTIAGAVFNEGDVVAPKIGNVRVLAQPSDTASAVATLARGEELVVVGTEQNGYVNVQGNSATGWVKKALLTRH